LRIGLLTIHPEPVSLKNMKKSTVPRILMATGLEENDVRYATGLFAPDPFCLLVDGSRRHVLVSALEAARVRKICPAAILHTPAQLFAETAPRRRHLSDQVLALVRQLKFRAVQVGPYFPVGIARALERGGVQVRLSAAPAFPRRAVKSAREIASLAKSQRAAVAALRAAIRCLRAATVSPAGVLKHAGKHLTSEILKELIEETLRRQGCSAAGTIVAVGPQGARPHDTGSGPVRAGMPVVIDIFPRDKATGYWGDITRTVVRGRASAALRRMHRDVLAAQKLALSMIRPGVESRAVQQAVEKFFRAAGHETRLSPPGKECGFIHSVGHGVGLDIHEAPGLRNEPGRLCAGNVVTVEPGLYYPGLGGVRIEDTVVVTRTGHKVLATFPKKLEV
jgi:Xaa-Pro aminopeptidase